MYFNACLCFLEHYKISRIVPSSMINISGLIKQTLVKFYDLLIKFRTFFRASGKKSYVKMFRWGLGVFISFFVLLVAIDVNFLWLFGESPSTHEILHPQQNIASEVYSEDSVLLGKYYYENRVPVNYSQISPILINTLIATEDERFYHHMGIDIAGSVAALGDMLKGNPRGASTITQQLVKNLYKTRMKNKRGILSNIPFFRVVIVKIKEMINAFKLELRFDKKDILTLYLNTVDFGNNTFGIRTAAKTYFNTTPSDLKYEQAALLVGMLKATSTYNPLTNKRRAVNRRNVVLRQMRRHGIIDELQYDSLQKLPLNLKLQFEKVQDGNAFYFRQAVIDYLKPWLNMNSRDIYADGLKIYTTVNSKMQKIAEASVAKNMRRLQSVFDEHWQGLEPWVDNNDKVIPGFVEMILHQSWEYKKLQEQFAGNPDSVSYYVNRKERRKLFSWAGPIDSLISLKDAANYNMRFLRCGMVAMDPDNGKIRAWVGDIDFSFFKFDHVNQSKRQPGSTFKAFVYTAAIDNGFSPCDSITDMPITVKYLENGVKKTWSPHNADWTYAGCKVTLKYAFARSLNSISVQLAEKTGWKKVVGYANKMGIVSVLDTFPSVCLGVSDVSLLELVTAYAPIANNGYRVTPIMVTKVTDRHGKTLTEYKPEKNRVLSEETAFLMQQLFLGTMTEPLGTTQALYQYDMFRYNTDIGGKTGTSSNHSDGWFVGITPKLVTGAWVGGEERCIHFKTSALGEGNKTALPVVGSFMEKVIKDTAFRDIRCRFSKNKAMEKRFYTCVTKNIPGKEDSTVNLDDIFDERDVSKIDRKKNGESFLKNDHEDFFRFFRKSKKDR